MPKVFTSKSQKKGELGEKIACRFLMKHGFSIIDRNFTRKWGEIDIIAEKGKKLYFIEVKSVSYDFTFLPSVAQPRHILRPEENMSPFKIKKLRRTVEAYLAFQNVARETQWQVDLLCVYLDQDNKKAQVKVIENVIL